MGKLEKGIIAFAISACFIWSLSYYFYPSSSVQTSITPGFRGYFTEDEMNFILRVNSEIPESLRTTFELLMTEYSRSDSMLRFLDTYSGISDETRREEIIAKEKETRGGFITFVVENPETITLLVEQMMGGGGNRIKLFKEILGEEYLRCAQYEHEWECDPVCAKAWLKKNKPPTWGERIVTFLSINKQVSIHKP